ncbi:MAG: FkbM family methyltransferase [Chitinophagaceae bacterium]|nr:MAG: FkbM family methyltransferase [Chitinophagaceae bacterium]
MQSLKRTFGFLHRHPVAQKNLLRAYYRFFSWQLQSRLWSDKLFVVPFVERTSFYAKRKLTGVTGSIYTGLQDFEEMAFLLHFLREEDQFFDIGANVGIYSVLAAGVRKCKTLAFEPNAATFEILQKNIQLNQSATLVQCENKGVGSKIATLRFTLDGDTTNHVVSHAEKGVPFADNSIVPLDQYSNEWQPNLIKIDVEGFETEVINGAPGILRQQNLKAILIELNGSGGRYGFDEEDLHRRFLGYGFAPFCYQPFERRLVKQESYGSFNTLYIRDIDYVTQRLKNAKPFTVWNTTV